MWVKVSFKFRRFCLAMQKPRVGASKTTELQQKTHDLKQHALSTMPREAAGNNVLEVCIDRSPKHFQAVVDIYHGLPSITTPPDMKGKPWPTSWIEELSEELNFYSLPPFGPGQSATILPPDVYRCTLNDLYTNTVAEIKQQHSLLADKLLSKLAARLANSSSMVAKEINLLKSNKDFWTHEGDEGFVKPRLGWIHAQAHGEDSSFAETFFITIGLDNDPHLLDMNVPWDEGQKSVRLSQGIVDDLNQKLEAYSGHTFSGVEFCFTCRSTSCEKSYCCCHPKYLYRISKPKL